MQTIADRLQSAHQQIALATEKAHRRPNSVQLLAVSKTKPVSDIRLAYAAGHRMFGENYVQEGVEKIQQTQDLSDIEWHFIGPLQSNKTRLVAEHFDWVQSIDRSKIARRLSEQRPAELADLNVCIQVNIDDESTKSGVGVDELDALIAECRALPRITVRGLMAIPDPSADATQQAKTLEQLAELFRHYQTSHGEFDTLSVGMSNDMSLAIAHGSTMVRIGTAIFGARN